MIKFKFKQSSCVAIGTFNIYIIQPKLLVEMGVFEASQPILMSGDVTQPGIRFEVGKSKWIVRPDRLSIESSDPDVDCGAYVGKTLAALCWTPIMAVGTNTVFESMSEAEGLLPTGFRLPVYPDAKQRTVHLTVPVGDRMVNVQLSCNEENLTMSLNSHNDFSGRRDNAPNLSEAVQEACGSFMQQRAAAVDIAKGVTSGEFVYE